MNIFLSFASEDRRLAEGIELALSGAGHRVFFDREDLMPAGEFHKRIMREIAEADAMVFLLSPSSVTPGNYALSELKFARARWPHPKGCVLPVLVQPLNWSAIPSYLLSVTVLQPEGNLAAEVVAAVEAMADEQSHGVRSIVRESENEVLLGTDLTGALANVRSALERVGRVTNVDAGNQFVEGVVAQFRLLARCGPGGKPQRTASLCIRRAHSEQPWVSHCR